MTTPTEAPREAGPEPLKVVAYRVDWPADFGIAPDRFYGSDDTHRMNCHLSYVHGVAAPIVVPLVRLADAQSALEYERQAHAAEVERLRADAARLDWIVRQADEFSCGMIADAPGDGEYIVHGMDGWGQGVTPREAIDQAIAKEKP